MANKEKTNGIPEETGKLVRLTDEDVGQVTGGTGYDPKEDPSGVNTLRSPALQGKGFLYYPPSPTAQERPETVLEKYDLPAKRP